jgi:hypothetical protein
MDIIFDRKEPFHFSFNRDAQIEAVMKIGRIKDISIEFISEMCQHPNYSSQIYWRELPIVRFSCFRSGCTFELLSNRQDILFQLIQPVIQHTNLRYIAIIVDLSLPGWGNPQEIIMVLNRVGKVFLIPSETALSHLDLLKIKKHWKIQVKKSLKSKEELKLLDIIAPESFPSNEFRISI